MGEEEHLPKGWKIHLDRKKKDAWDTYRKFRPTAAGGEKNTMPPEKGGGGEKNIATPEQPAMPGGGEKIVVEEEAAVVKQVVETVECPHGDECNCELSEKGLARIKAAIAESDAAAEPVPEPVVEKKAEKGKARVISSSWTREKKNKKVDVK